MKTQTTLIALILSLNSLAQVVVSGQIQDKHQNPLPGVNIWIKETFDGTTSDANGAFSFETEEADSLILMCTFIGYHDVEQLLGARTGLQITLKEKVNQLNAVNITAGSIEVTDKASSVVMKPMDILTTAGALGDVTGALNTLPGTQTVANDGRLFVRGGDASETAIFFDGLRVGNAYGTTAAGVPTRNRFSPTLFKGTFFSTGGYSAEYGDALSSVLSLETIDKPVRNQTDLSFMTVGVSASSSFVGEKQSVTAEIGVINLEPYQDIVKQNFDWEKSPASYDGQVVYRHKLGKDGMIKGFLQGSSSKMAIWQAVPGDDSRGRRIAINNQFAFANVSYKKPISDAWLAEGGVSMSLNDDEVEYDSIGYETDQNLFHIKQKFTNYLSESFKVKLGAEGFFRSFDQADVSENLEAGYDAWSGAAFAEAEWFVSTRFTLRGGLRGTYDELNDHKSLEPRFAAAYQPYPKGTISFAYGQFTQGQTPEVRIWNNQLKHSQAEHLQLSYQHSDDRRTFRAEVYQKNYDQLYRLENERSYANGTGVAQGADFFYRERKLIKNADFWITYSYVHSRRQLGNFESEVQPSYAPSHNLSVVAKYWIEGLKSQVGGSWTLNSGYTYQNPNMPGEMNSLSPNYGSLSLNWSYLYKQNLILHVAVNNVTGRENVFGETYSLEPDSNGNFQSLPKVQPANRFIFVGVFWTISKDKQANQLNNL